MAASGSPNWKSPRSKAFGRQALPHTSQHNSVRNITHTAPTVEYLASKRTGSLTHRGRPVRCETPVLHPVRGFVYLPARRLRPAFFPPSTPPEPPTRCSPTSSVLCCRPNPRRNQRQDYGYQPYLPPLCGLLLSSPYRLLSEVSRFSCGKCPRMPGSLTPPGKQPLAHRNAAVHVAFDFRPPSRLPE